jgi:hypothetical protein
MTDTKAKVELKLTEAQQTALIELAAEHEELKELNLKPEDFEAPGDEEDEDADAEEDDEGDGTETTPAAPVTKVPATVGLSRDATAAIELAQADASAARAETIELSRRLRAAEVQREVESWENKGLAPSLIALARPALEAPAVIELSNGKKTDAGAVVRGLLTEMVELAKRGEDVIELGMLSGALLADPEIQQSTMDAQLASLRQQFDS